MASLEDTSFDSITSAVNDAMSSNEDQAWRKAARELVCNKCWTDLFNTQAWENFCLGRGLLEAQTIQYQIPLIDLKPVFCEWCKILDGWILGIGDDRLEGPPGSYVEATLSRAYDPKILMSEQGLVQLMVDLKGFEYMQMPAYPARAMLYAEAHDPAATYVLMRPFEEHVNTRAARQQLQKWLQECNEHACCGRQSDIPLPTRVIDTTVDPPRIVHTQGQKGKYVALSYAWGARPNGKVLVTDCLSEWSQGLDVEVLPRTIRDAISVTRSIGSTSYLWIDALCIIQDSFEDKEKEIPQMLQYYGSATVVIAAASASHADIGFLETKTPLRSHRSPPLKCRLPFRISKRKYGTILMHGTLGKEYNELDEPINQRAWTLQEQVLAKRQMIYTSHTLQYRCNNGTINLGPSLNISRGVFDRSRPTDRSIATLSQPRTTNTEAALIKWLLVVQEYTRRDLSYSQDKLVALSGLAAGFAESIRAEYYAGLWNNRMIPQLCWRSSFMAVGNPSYVLGENNPVRHNRSASYRAPSWSWASIDGQVFFPPPLFDSYSAYKTIQEDCEVITCHVEAVGYGEVKSAVLRLSGMLRPAWFVSQTRNILWLQEGDDSFAAAEKAHVLSWPNGKQPGVSVWERDFSGDYKLIFKPRANGREWAAARRDEEVDSPPRRVWCLPLRTYEDALESFMEGLVLVKTVHAFCRIGFFERVKPAEFDKVKSREVVLV